MADKQTAGLEIPLRTHWFALLWLLFFTGLIRSVASVFGSWWNIQITDDLWSDDDPSVSEAVRLAVIGAPPWIAHYFSQAVAIAVVAYGVFVVLRTITGAPMRRWLHI